jgi:hypothetical protein
MIPYQVPAAFAAARRSTSPVEGHTCRLAGRERLRRQQARGSATGRSPLFWIRSLRTAGRESNVSAATARPRNTPK